MAEWRWSSACVCVREGAEVLVIAYTKVPRGGSVGELVWEWSGPATPPNSGSVVGAAVPLGCHGAF